MQTILPPLPLQADNKHESTSILLMMYYFANCVLMMIWLWQQLGDEFKQWFNNKMDTQWLDESDSEYEDEDDDDDDNTEPPVPVPIPPYERWYLKKYREMKPYAMFEHNEEKKQLCDKECLEMLKRLKKQRGMLQTLCDWTQNTPLEEEIEDYICTTFGSDANFKHVSNNSCSGDVDDYEVLGDVYNVRGTMFNRNAILEVVQEQLRECIEEIENYPSNKLIEQAQKTVCETVLNARLINTYVSDTTPIGNVMMRFNHERGENGGFEYYSDREMIGKYLEPVARKYVINFDCAYLYVDAEKEIELEKERQKEKREREQQEKATADATATNNNSTVAQKTRPIFARFKSYNKLPRHLSPVTMISKQQQRVKTRNNVNSSTGEAVPLRSNRFYYMGKLGTFNPLQKKTKNETDKKKETMSYADYKNIK